MKIKLITSSFIIGLLSYGQLFAQNILSVNKVNLGATVGGNVQFTSTTGAFTGDDGNLKIGSLTIAMHQSTDCTDISPDETPINNPWQTPYALNTLDTIPAIIHITDSGLTAVGNFSSGNDPSIYHCVRVYYTLTTQPGAGISPTPAGPTECQDLTYNPTTHLYNTSCSSFTGNSFTISKT